MRILTTTHAAVMAATIIAVTTSHAFGAEAVTVAGNQRIDISTIEQAFGEPGKNGRYSEQQLDEGVKQLFGSGFFSDVKASQVDGKLAIAVVENPYVGSIVFNGNARLKDDVLLRSVKLLSGAPFSEATLDRDMVTISEAYARAGRPNARVNKLVVPREGNVVDVAFTVIEGDKTKLSSIEFKGAEAFSANRLKGIISTKETGPLSFVKNDDVYDVDRGEADAKEIERFYHDNGYIDAIVSGPEVVLDDKENAIYLAFDISEGRQYSVGNVSVDVSARSFPPSVKSVIPASLPKGIYSPTRVAAAAEKAEREASVSGQPDLDIRPRASRSEDGTVDVTYQVDQGPKSYVERIDITGNLKTADYVIRREIDFSEGDMFNKSMIRQVEKRLKALGFFKSVSISVAKGSAEDRVVLNVAVDEASSGSFEIGGGYSSKDGPLAVVSFNESNFMGTGRGLRASVGRGLDTGTYDLGLTEPYLMGTRLTGDFSLFRRDWSEQDNKFHPYDETLTGARFGLTAPITDTTLVTLWYGISNQEITGVDDQYSGVGTTEDPNLITKGDYVRSVLGGEWLYSTLDDKDSPTDGIQLKASQEWAGIGGDASYVKTEALAKTVKELDAVRDIVAHLSVKGGSINGIGKDLSFTDQFRPGGDLVRGFANGGIGPRDLSTGLSLGGQYYAGASAEARMPMPLFPETYGLKSAFFADAGTVWHADQGRVTSSGATVGSNSASIRASLGTGIIWDSPLGVLRADFSLPVVKQDGDRTQWFSFSGGTRF